jgi:hypothetical protein
MIPLLVGVAGGVSLLLWGFATWWLLLALISIYVTLSKVCGGAGAGG